MMPLTSLELIFRKSVDDRRFRSLARALDGIQSEIEKEAEQLRRARNRMMDCAAFSLEMVENGERSERMPAKLDTLARGLEANRARKLLLGHQMSLLTTIRDILPNFLRSHRV
ncbi:MAG: hypothetical protein E5X34_11415 [Mesorhizobium sp.]|uniref:hypothetical protein n=1 Tax=Mesorhizobium sp. TaxID=1871066 RepID=UPI001215DD0A|nr:hypothetical protein [Mesorhizobium sp.]TIR24109.1 MAG: hypothetical protein E5X34_11415 [Mesorhizobium sp.]